MTEQAGGKTARRRGHPTVAIAAAIMVAGIGIYFFVFGRDTGPEIIVQSAWAGHGIMAIFDHHTHTRSSDGALSESDLVDLALGSSCDVLAITDHSDVSTSVSAAQFGEIDRLRQAWPELVLFAGLEVNMPSYNGREHVTVLTHPSAERTVLPALRLIAEKTNTGAEDPEADRGGDREFLQSINAFAEDGAEFALLYNHPSRKDEANNENPNDLISWLRIAPYFIGFEGAPGHQKTDPVGSYGRTFQTIDRWDPVVAEVGGAWDQLLGRGHQFWGAIAGSDYHNGNLDFPPCAFARTHLELAELSHIGVLNALRAGTFWADHGQLLERLSFVATVEGLDDPLYPGAVVQLGKDMSSIVLDLAISRGAGAMGEPLIIEIIGNCEMGSPQLLASQKLEAGVNRSTLLLEAKSAGMDGKSCYARARVRLENAIDPDLLAVTNPIRFRLRQ